MVYTANKYSQCTAFVQSKGCNENLITAIDSALSLAVIYYSQATANVQLMTAEVLNQVTVANVTQPKALK